MVSIVTGGRLLTGVALILTNGFFVATEFALTRVRQYDESEFDDPGLRRAWEMTERLEIYLTSCQVGITASSIALGVVAEPALVELLAPLTAVLSGALPVALPGGSGHVVGATLAFIIINLLHLTHGEQTPTYLGIEKTKFVARYGAGPLYWFTKAITPLIAFGDWVAKATLRLFGIDVTRPWAEDEEELISTRAALRSEINEALSQGPVSDEREQEILNALQIGDEPVGQIMVPREGVVPLSVEDEFETNLARMQEHPHVRFPLVEGDFEGFRGVVYSPDVLRNLEPLRSGQTTLTDISRDAVEIDSETSVSDAIDRFQSAGEELALVVDAGDVVGLLTATDAWEAITGELEDPLDEYTPAA